IAVMLISFTFFFQAEDGIRGFHVTGVQTCALPIWGGRGHRGSCLRSTAVGRPRRRLIPSVDDFAAQGINATVARHTCNQRRNGSLASPSDTMNRIDDDELRQLLPSLRRFALWLARDPADADDLVQACIERALSRWSTRRGDASLKAWLFAILHRQFIDQRRRAGRWRGVLA